MTEERNVQDFCTDEEEVVPAEENFDTADTVDEGYFTGETADSSESDSGEPQPFQEDSGANGAFGAELMIQLAEQNAALREQLGQMNEKLDKLTVQIVNTNRAVAMHETIEGNLNKELQGYKNDFYGNLAAPFLMQLISLYSEMDKEINELKAEMEASAESTGHEDVVMSLEYYRDKVLGSLTNSGVEIRIPEPGNKIDPIEQRIVRTVPCDDPEKNGIIESVKGNAYVYNGKILLPAKVAVYKA